MKLKFSFQITMTPRVADRLLAVTILLLSSLGLASVTLS